MTARSKLDGLEPWVRVLELWPEAIRRRKPPRHPLQPSARPPGRPADPAPPPATELLDELAAAFQRARAEIDAAALHPAGAEPAGTCRYCGLRRDRLFATRLDGHARCLVGRAFMRRLRDVLLASTTLSFNMVAELLGVSNSTVRGWYRIAGELAASDERASQRVESHG